MDPINCETLLYSSNNEIITNDDQDQYSDKIYRKHTDSHNLLLTQHLLHNNNDRHNNDRNSNIPNRNDDFSKDTRIITILFLSLAHLGLIVGSYVSTWSDVYMTINEDDNESSSGDEDEESAVVEIPIKTGENLWSFIKLFFESNAAIISILVIISAICLPIYQIIQHPFLINDIIRHTKTSVGSDRDDRDDDERRTISEDAPRCAKNGSSSSVASRSTRRSLLFFEIASKIALSVTMVSTWLLIATSIHLTVETSAGTNVHFEIISKIKGGTVAFLLGANAGIGTVALLRHVLDVYGDAAGEGRDGDVSNPSRRRLVPSMVTRWDSDGDDRGSSSSFSSDDEDDNVCTTTSSQRPPRHSSTRPPTRHRVFLHRLLFYQSAGIASMLYPLTFFRLPLVRWDYSGIGASFLSETSRDVTLIEAGYLVWSSTKGMTYSVVVTGLFWATVVVLPSVVFGLCLLLLVFSFFCVEEGVGDDGDRRRMTTTAARGNEWALALYRLLRFLYPFANVVTFAVSTIIIAYEMELVSEYLFDSNVLCEKLGSHHRDSVDCLVIKGRVLDGGWYFLVQSVCLEVFAYLTIKRFKIV